MFFFKQRIVLWISLCMLALLGTACFSLPQTGDANSPATQTALQATFTALQAKQQENSVQVPTPTADEVIEVAAQPLVVDVPQELCELAAASSGEALWSTHFDNTDCLSLFAISDSAVGESDYAAEITQKGRYSFSIRRSYTSVYAVAEHIILPEDESDVVLDMALDYREGPNEVGFSLLCRVNLVGWYEFLVTSGGRWQIMNTRDSGLNFEILASGGIDFRQYGLESFKQGSYNFQASCVGDELALSVNGIPVSGATVRDLTQTHTAGSVGFALFALDSIWEYAENPVVVDFKSFEVRRP